MCYLYLGFLFVGVCSHILFFNKLKIEYVNIHVNVFDGMKHLLKLTRYRYTLFYLWLFDEWSD